jgi:hypothetical protein
VVSVPVAPLLERRALLGRTSAACPRQPLGWASSPRTTVLFRLLTARVHGEERRLRASDKPPRWSAAAGSDWPSVTAYSRSSSAARIRIFGRTSTARSWSNTAGARRSSPTPTVGTRPAQPTPTRALLARVDLRAERATPTRVQEPLECDLPLRRARQSLRGPGLPPAPCSGLTACAHRPALERQLKRNLPDIRGLCVPCRRAARARDGHTRPLPCDHVRAAGARAHVRAGRHDIR